MPIRHEHVEAVLTTPERAFAAIDDLPLTSRWLPGCVSLGKAEAGPNAPGDRLRYVYTQGGKTGEMSGEIIARTPGERLHCRYYDGAFEVSVDLRVAATPDGAIMIHTMEITPKRFAARIMSPLIRLGLAKRARDAATNLKHLLESAGS